MASVPLRRSSDARFGRGAQVLERVLVDPLRFAGFWAAVALPFVLLALVFAGAAAQRAELFAGLVGANLVALRLGRGYGRE